MTLRLADRGAYEADLPIPRVPSSPVGSSMAPVVRDLQLSEPAFFVIFVWLVFSALVEEVAQRVDFLDLGPGQLEVFSSALRQPARQRGPSPASVRQRGSGSPMAVQGAMSHPSGARGLARNAMEYNEVMHEHLTESRRQEIFLALVTAQDHDISVSESRKLIAHRFAISEGEVLKIEREGIENNWPPL
jgi:hypothetical protein